MMKATIVRAICLLVMSGAIGACTRDDRATPAPAPRFEDVLNSQDAERISAWFTDDAALLPENLRRVSGKGDILQYYKDLASSDLAYRVNATGVTADRKLAVSEGTYRVLNVKTGAEVEIGKYLAVLKHIDAGWRVHRLMTNTDISPPKTTVTVDTPNAGL